MNGERIEIKTSANKGLASGGGNTYCRLPLETPAIPNCLTYE